MSSIEYIKTNIQWYPGHMTKARRMIEENIPLVDAVCEIRDARIPYSSGNPDIKTLSEGKPRLIIINRIDLADPAITSKWVEYFENDGAKVILTDAKSGKGVDSFIPAIKSLLRDKIQSYELKGQSGRSLRVMILGVPNVGKSTFINKVAKRKVAIAGDKPGVTRGKQWISIDKGIDLLDTPGILWPKFESQEVGELLAVTNAIKIDVFDVETLAANFMTRLSHYYPEAITKRYGVIPDSSLNGYELLESCAKKRGMIVSKNEYDIDRMAHTLLNEYHEGKLGRLSLEDPNDIS